MAKYSKKAQDKVGDVMHEFKKGKLKSGSGDKVKSRKQAIAIGISEARDEGYKTPSKKRTAGKKSISGKRTTVKKTASKKSTGRRTASKKSTSRKTSVKRKSSSSKTTRKKAK